jgi:hypothetical protein
MTTQSDYWYALATKIIRTEMTKRNLTYEELVKNLREIGVDIYPVLTSYAGEKPLARRKLF